MGTFVSITMRRRLIWSDVVEKGVAELRDPLWDHLPHFFERHSAALVRGCDPPINGSLRSTIPLQ